MKTDNKLVFGYVRGSDEKQQNTLVAQRNQIEEYCRYKQLTLAGIIIDEGESAFKVNFYERPLVADLLMQARQAGAGGIVITKLDRGFRNALDCLFTVEDLANRGIGLHLLDLGLEPDTPVGKLLLTMMAAIAEFENRRRAERQLASSAVMAAAGQRRGAIPYGWDAVPAARMSKTGRQADDLIPNAAEQKILAFIAAASEGGVSDNEIARRLNRRGIPTKNGGMPFQRNGRTRTAKNTWNGPKVRSVRLTFAKLSALTPKLP